MSHQNIQTMFGDCLELMPLIPDGSVDMILCDLPYGTTQNAWDSVLPLEALWREYKRVCSKNAAIVLTAAQPFTSTLVLSNLKALKQCLVWEKNVASNFLNANRQHLSVHEDVCVFSYGSPVYNPQMSPGEAYIAKRYGNDDSGDCYGRVAQRTDTVNGGGRLPKSVLHFDREIGLHPTQKPVALFAYLIRTYTNPGDLVLDNCAGSFTTGEACIQEGRRAILMEKDPIYYERGDQRLLGVTPNLFAMEAA